MPMSRASASAIVRYFEEAHEDYLVAGGDRETVEAKYQERRDKLVQRLMGSSKRPKGVGPYAPKAQ